MRVLQKDISPYTRAIFSSIDSVAKLLVPAIVLQMIKRSGTSKATPIPTDRTTDQRVSQWRCVWNTVGCLSIIPLYIASVALQFYWMTFDLILASLLAEINRYSNKQRRKEAMKPLSLLTTRSSVEPTSTSPHDQPRYIRSVASIVGYREDLFIFEKALQSYKSARGCAFVIVCIDGDDKEDMEMVYTFNKVFEERSATLHVNEPMGEVATRVYQLQMQNREADITSNDAREAYSRKFAIDYCCNIARQLLLNHNIDLSQPECITRLCLYQHHMHKKGIMFTSFIFSLVICEMLSVDYLWSSDSDTFVYPDTLAHTVAAIAGNNAIGGASSGLVVHNSEKTICTRLGSAIYWSELYTTRSGPASVGSSDCQSGPSATFRVRLLSDILLPWYNQKVVGQRMIINEDRHLTTILIARGWKIAFVSDVLAATETPETVARWVGQQVRWARAAHIESFQQPKIYMLSHPLFFWAALKREVTPLLAFIAVILYVFAPMRISSASLIDAILRAVLGFAYNCARNPDRNLSISRLWAIPGLLFYNIPLPAIQVWSLVTVLNQGWVTSMRARGHLADKNGLSRRWNDGGFLVVWMGIVGAATGKGIFELADWCGIQVSVSIAPVMLSFGLVMSSFTWYLMIWE